MNKELESVESLPKKSDYVVIDSVRLVRLLLVGNQPETGCNIN